MSAHNQDKQNARHWFVSNVAIFEILEYQQSGSVDNTVELIRILRHLFHVAVKEHNDGKQKF